MLTWNNLSTWNSSFLDLSSIEVDLKKEKEEEKEPDPKKKNGRRRRRKRKRRTETRYLENADPKKKKKNREHDLENADPKKRKKKNRRFGQSDVENVETQVLKTRVTCGFFSISNCHHLQLKS